MTRPVGSGLRHRLPPRRRSADRGEAAAQPGPPEIASEYSTEELQEFLEADQLAGEVDPEFREGLRRRLWELLEAERARRTAERDD